MRDVDVVLDAVGGDYQARSLRTLRRGGVLISLLPLQPGVADQAAQAGAEARVMLCEADRAGMIAIADLVDRGKLRPVVAGAFPLAEAARAHEIGDGGHVAGQARPHHALTADVSGAGARAAPWTRPAARAPSRTAGCRRARGRRSRSP